jgi:hypothetical protein
MDWKELLGGDGHATMYDRVLNHAGIDSVEKLRRITDRELLSLRTIGPEALDRLHEAVHHCDEWGMLTDRQKKQAADWVHNSPLLEARALRAVGWNDYRELWAPRWTDL